jgi:N-acetyl-gamma-glutamyl-phosphate reductase
VGAQPSTKRVYGTNNCEIQIEIDKQTNSIIVTAAIDNLVKGAAGQAIQNANLLFGYPEELGLLDIGMPI